MTAQRCDDHFTSVYTAWVLQMTLCFAVPAQYFQSGPGEEDYEVVDKYEGDKYEGEETTIYYDDEGQQHVVVNDG